MTAGSISHDEFRSLVEKFVDISNKIDDKWHLDRAAGILFMCKRNVISDASFGVPKDDSTVPPAVVAAAVTTYESSSSAVLPLQKGQTDLLAKLSHSSVTPKFEDLKDKDDDVVGEMEMDDEDDESCMPRTDSTKLQSLTYEYHIIYSESFSVPVLYFNIFKSDGQHLPLEEVWKLCPATYQEYLTENKWATLTQQEHPLLGRPFLQLHPCHTADVMSKVLSCAGSNGRKNYLATWLSTIGPMVGLHISPKYITYSH